MAAADESECPSEPAGRKSGASAEKSRDVAPVKSMKVGDVASSMAGKTRSDTATSKAGDDVVAFELDEDFDYDNVVLSGRTRTMEGGWVEHSTGQTYADIVAAAGGAEALAEKVLQATAKSNG